MSKITNGSNESDLVDLSEISINLNGETESPTREEFYTNYPFYKYWNTDKNQKLQEPEAINIYIHIPFCIQICDYCFYMKELIKSKDQVDNYVNSLCQEIKLISERFGLQNRKVNSIYIGGGTPSVLSEVQFRRLIETINRHHRIEELEFAFEAEPGTFNQTKLNWLKECGVNRISMGVQSFDDDIIKLSSRKHTAAQAIKSINLLQETGGFEVNIDLLSGLAGETMDSWRKSVDIALDQNVDMLTIYKMKTYSNTNFFKKGVHANEIELPNATTEVLFMKSAIQTVRDRGYNLWTNFAFTRNGSQSKYAEFTWRGQDLIAYGASSFGQIGRINYQNLNNISLYSDKVKDNLLPIYRTYELTIKEMIVKELLLCSARLVSYSKQEFIEKYGFDYFLLIPNVIDQLTSKGYITANKAELELTNQGVLYGDFVSKVIASSVKNMLGMDNIGFTY